MVLLSKVPGMTIFAPSSYQDLQVMLHDALDLAGPAAIRFPKTAARNVPEGDVGVGLHARRLRPGHTVCVLAVGKMVGPALEAAEALEGGGLGPTVWDVRVVKPLDPAMIADAAQHDLVVTIEDGLRDGGAGAAIADAVSRHAVQQGQPTPRIEVLGVPSEFIAHGKPDDILRDLGLDAAGVAATVTSRLPLLAEL
jgi:1-deoxy-D-xylulose-5-phosphate synthase